MKKIDVLLGFDMETDIGSWTPYYKGLVHGTPPLLKLLKRCGATGTFYFTGDAARHSPSTVRLVRKDGHEIGTHSLSHETVGDSLFPIPGISPLLTHEIKARLALNTRIVKEIAGVTPRSFRSPRLFGSTAVCNALEDLGYLSDASYPMYFYRRQITPYHPSRKDWTRTGKLSLVEIPNFANLAMKSRDPYGRDRDQWPLFRTQSTRSLLKHVDAFLGYLEKRKICHAVLCFYFHPWEFYPMPQGLIHYGEGAVRPDPFLVKNCGKYALQQFEILLQEFNRRGAAFKTAAQIAREWR